ncbi:MAG: flagellar biosynthetic protein FliO [Alphaproteobacteria bacterium]|nr:flagellar biosynthetic protein FliO [Alphaproteobacteria bacterium]
MDYADYLKFFFALVFVLALMGGLAYLMKRLGWGQGGISPLGSKNKKRLKIVEILPLDARRKAVIIQRDDIQHLVLLSASGETVIETNIKAPKDTEDDTRN